MRAFGRNSRWIIVQNRYRGVMERAAESRAPEKETGVGPVVRCARGGGGVGQDGSEDMIREGGEGVFGGVVGNPHNFRTHFLPGGHFGDDQVIVKVCGMDSRAGVYQLIASTLALAT